MLAAGTTAGVAALVVTPLVPVTRLRLRLRPALRFPAGVGARVRSLAVAGVVTLVAQDASVAVVIVLANSRGGGGALVLYSFAWAVFFVPYAVLAVPIATSAFPELSARADTLRRHRGHLHPRGDGGVLARGGRDGRAPACRWPGSSSPTSARRPTPGSWPSRWPRSRRAWSATA